MGSSFRVFFDVVWIFLCVAVFNVDSCGSGGRLRIKNCIDKDKIYGHGSTFDLPSKPCQRYKFDNQKITRIKAECMYKGRCFKLGSIVGDSSGPIFKCILDHTQRSYFEQIHKDCNVLGETLKHRSIFYFPFDSCHLHRCYDGKVEALKSGCHRVFTGHHQELHFQVWLSLLTAGIWCKLWEDPAGKVWEKQCLNALPPENGGDEDSGAIATVTCRLSHQQRDRRLANQGSTQPQP
ncbi:hypothetical protein PoB_002708600 [Plakobranchus ocellatus]|uniref:Uncharacterized protein n=1 Tax=Plakobranchus ocellatus TaxID=259542 RepID=A0AAV3ZNC5_9GAST|nr:hypothetical protein PoB_002708600 [Plakobranchus ocellatus]